MDFDTLASRSTTTLPPRPSQAEARGREVAAQFEGLLFARALEPMAKSCGFLGDSVVAIVATDLARHDRGALATTLDRAIESARAGEASR